MLDAFTDSPLSPRDPGTPDLSGIGVLVIEQDIDNLELFATFFRYCGADVVTARSASAAMEHARGKHIHAVITDVSAFKGSGLREFFSYLRDVPAYTRTPVIAVTGWDRKHLAADVDKFAAFMQKPVNLDDLATTIRKVVRFG
jgi:DNA-binding NtrC family response regulator